MRKWYPTSLYHMVLWRRKKQLRHFRGPNRSSSKKFWEIDSELVSETKISVHGGIKCMKITFRVPSYGLVIFQYSPTPICAGEGWGVSGIYGMSHMCNLHLTLLNSCKDTCQRNNQRSIRRFHQFRRKEKMSLFAKNRPGELFLPLHPAGGIAPISIFSLSQSV